MLAGGCGPGTAGNSPRPAASTSAGTDPPTAAALLRIAQNFNDDYDRGNFGTVYDRWDSGSRAIISRSEYIRRHHLCAPATGETALVEGAVRAGDGRWHVRYEIGGEQLTDTWFYVHHHWVFDVVLSNPDAARQYRMPFAQYAAAAGCNAH